MKTIKHFALALVAVACGLGFTSCDQNKPEQPEQPDNYADYPQLIVGKWFNFTPETSILLDFKADKTAHTYGFDRLYNYWADIHSTYSFEGNKLIQYAPDVAEEWQNIAYYVELTNDKLIIKDNEVGDRVHYRVKESFDIKGNYTYLNSAVRVVAAEGKTALQRTLLLSLRRQPLTTRSQ